VSLPQVPGFTVSGRLGVGASATVWSATRDVDVHPVALKLVPGPGAAWEEGGSTSRQGSAAEQAAREAGVLAGIDHPHVVRLHAATALADGTLVLVLDLVDGGSYAAVVGARGHLHPGEVVTALSPVARAVADLHALGVVHADLSPGNVLFTCQGKPMVSDLGVARLFGEGTGLVRAHGGAAGAAAAAPGSQLRGRGRTATAGSAGGAVPVGPRSKPADSGLRRGGSLRCRGRRAGAAGRRIRPGRQHHAPDPGLGTHRPTTAAVATAGPRQVPPAHGLGLGARRAVGRVWRRSDGTGEEQASRAGEWATGE
jgi:serine/threonine protein kinase